jgi:hypothetical protein
MWSYTVLHPVCSARYDICRTNALGRVRQNTCWPGPELQTTAARFLEAAVDQDHAISPVYSAFRRVLPHVRVAVLRLL